MGAGFVLQYFVDVNLSNVFYKHIFGICGDLGS